MASFSNGALDRFRDMAVVKSSSPQSSRAGTTVVAESSDSESYSSYSGSYSGSDSDDDSIEGTPTVEQVMAGLANMQVGRNNHESEEEDQNSTDDYDSDSSGSWSSVEELDENEKLSFELLQLRKAVLIQQHQRMKRRGSAPAIAAVRTPETERLLQPLVPPAEMIRNELTRVESTPQMQSLSMAPQSLLVRMQRAEFVMDSRAQILPSGSIRNLMATSEPDESLPPRLIRPIKSSSPPPSPPKPPARKKAPQQHQQLRLKKPQQESITTPKPKAPRSYKQRVASPTRKPSSTKKHKTPFGYVTSAASSIVRSAVNIVAPISKPPVESKWPENHPHRHYLRILDRRFGLRDVRPISASSLRNFFVPMTPANINAYDLAKAHAVRTQDVPALREMHGRGEILQCCNRFGESIVHTACRRNSVGVLEFLIKEAKVSLRVVDDYGRTVCHDACWTTAPSWPLLKLLLESNPELLLVADQRGCAPLDYLRDPVHWESWCQFLDANVHLLKPRALMKELWRQM